MTSPLAPFRLILVSPLYAGNVGACARVAANFDVQDIAIISPRCQWKSPQALTYAKGPARNYLDLFKQWDHLAQALDGCSHAIAFTRRQGHLRQPSVRLDELSTLVLRTQQKIALVFGPEDFGLNAEDAALCNHICTFSTAAVMPSMNLSHAVAVVLSRLYEDRSRCSANTEEIEPTAIVSEHEELFAHWRNTMIHAGMTTGGNPDRMMAHFRRALQRASLTARDIGLFRAFLSKVQVAMGTRHRTRSTSDQSP